MVTEEDHSTVQVDGTELTKLCPFSVKQCRTADRQGIVFGPKICYLGVVCTIRKGSILGSHACLVI